MKTHSTALCLILLLGWITGILVPLYSLRQMSPLFEALFDWAFQSHVSHVLMHAVLYAVLAVLLAMLCAPFCISPRRLSASVMIGVALVAAAQESIQVSAEHLQLGADEVFDFFVDLNGGLLGLHLFRARRSG
ncbi:MAG: hypothetical protein ACI9OU_002321 [Candidatus Promineifilaceae bacterium]|jgi:hypothetical protein